MENKQKILFEYAKASQDELLKNLNTSLSGLSDHEASHRLKKQGLNEVTTDHTISWFTRLIDSFKNPLIILYSV